MRHCIMLSLFLSACNVLSFAGSDNNKTISPDVKEQAAQWMRAQPVHFLENKGQMTDTKGNPVPFVLFKAQIPGLDMYVTEKGLTYMFLKAEEEEESEKEHSEFFEKEEENIQIEYCRIDMDLEGASIKKENIVKEAPSVTDHNFFYAHCADGIYGVKQYEKITIKEVYPGIDWLLYNVPRKGFKYDFIVHPGGDPKNIQLIYASLNPLKLNNNGSIEITTKLGTLTEQAPYSYIKETNQEIATEFQIAGQQHINNTYYETTLNLKLDPDSYRDLNHKHQTLVIDPLITPTLTWGTYYGGSNYDGFCSVAADASGNIFVAGYMNSINLITLNPGGSAYFQGVFGGGTSDAFILKFNNAGVLLWATYYGGNGWDEAHSLSIDTNDNVFVTGYTGSNNFPILNPIQGVFAGGYDVFILKFNNAGVRLWATYYGGSGSDWAHSSCTDPLGNVFVSGYTASSNFPVLNPFQGAFAGGASDAFILKFNNAGTLLWSTYYGGSSSDIATSIVAEGSGNVFVTGNTSSNNFPVLNPIQGAFAGISDAFILKFSNANVLIWATYYGGAGNDGGCSVAVDGNNDVFITGETTSINFPTVNPGGGAYFQPGNAGAKDIFILKFTNGGILLWATYYGGAANDGFYSAFAYSRDKEIIVDGGGDVFITGLTNSTNFPTLSSGGYFQSVLSGTQDVFILQFSNTGVQKWATFNGTTTSSPNGDFGSALAMDPSGCLFAVGEWGGTSNGLANPGAGAYYDGTFSGSDDAYIMKFCPSVTVLSTVATSQNVLCNGQCNGTGTTVPSSGTAPYTYLWNAGGQTTSSATGLCVGIYTVTVTDAIGSTATATVVISQPTILTATATASSSACSGNNGSATVNAGGGTPGYSYSWNTSPPQTTANATGLGAGNYTVTVTDANGCDTTQLVAIVASGSITATATNSTICGGQSATLTASGGNNYSWSMGATTTSVNVSPTSTTSYSVIVSSGSCVDTALAVVTVNASPIASAASNTTITKGQSATLTASGGGTYSWNSGANDSSITVTPSVTAIYCVTVTNANGCTDFACVTVYVEPTDCSPSVMGELFLPNAFSPNDDGENDVIKIYYRNYACIRTFKLVIYDRWGEKVFETTDPEFIWNGNYKGNAMNTAVFIYYMDVTLTSGEQINRKGNISLIR